MTPQAVTTSYSPRDDPKNITNIDPANHRQGEGPYSWWEGFSQGAKDGDVSFKSTDVDYY